MKKRNLIFLLLIGLFCMTAILTGCSNSVLGNSDGKKTPQSAIQEAYGNAAYKISFNSEGLTTPVSDVEYTANHMPVLPIPERIGYIFEGWYFDEDYNIPYMDGMLYLYMKDVTLYAKWSKETIVQDGIYEFEFSLDVAEETVVTATPGDRSAIKGFLSSVVKDDICIEKGGDKIQLKFPYDLHSFSKFDGRPTYSVSLNLDKTGIPITMGQSIENMAETMRTVYLNVDKFIEYDMSAPIYLHIIAYDWERDATNEEIAKNSKAEFDVAFRITRFIGITKSYVDPDIDLEEGYYLLKSYYYQTTNEISTMNVYNPVYSYIRSQKDEKGELHYTLIKPFYPYTMADSGTIAQNLYLFHERYCTFALPFASYRVHRENGKLVNDEYVSDAYIEFHADEGKYFFIMDLGKDLKSDIMMNLYVSGPMEALFKFGSIHVVCVMDYEHISRLSSVDYTPLDGDGFAFNEEFFVSSPVGSPFEESAYEIYDRFGNSAYFPFYYFSSWSDSETSEGRIYSYRSHVTPAFDDFTANDTKNQMLIYNRNVTVYGYNEKTDGYLYSDNAVLNTLSNSESSGWRTVLRKNIGKSVESGAHISMEQTYRELVDPDDIYSSYTVYPIKNRNIDYSTQLDYGETFTFNENVAIVFVRENGEYKNETLVRLTFKNEPVVWFEENNGIFDPSEEKTYQVGDRIDLPNLWYEWGGLTGYFIGNYYESDEKGPIKEYRPQAVRFYSVASDGTYTLKKVEANQYENDEEDRLDFRLGEGTTAIVYDLINAYGEIYKYELRFTAEELILNTAALYRDNEVVEEFTVSASENRKGVSLGLQTAWYDAELLPDFSDVEEMLSHRYYIKIGDNKSELLLTSANIYTDKLFDEPTFTSQMYGDLRALIHDKVIVADRALLVLTYTDGLDKYTVRYLYGIRFGGAKEFVPITYDNVFTNVQYSFKLDDLFDLAGVKIAAIDEVEVYKGTNPNLSIYSTDKAGSQYVSNRLSNGILNIMFYHAGSYVIQYRISGRYDVNGNRIYGNGYHFEATQICFNIPITVIDSGGYGTVTYDVGGSGHLYLDGSDKKTVEYRLTNPFALPASSEFDEHGGRLIAWAIKEDYSFRDGGNKNCAIIYVSSAIQSLVATFNAKNVTLYPIWDDGATFTIEVPAESMKDGSSVLNETATYWVDFERNPPMTSYVMPYLDIYAIITKNLKSGYLLIGVTVNGKYIPVSTLSTTTATYRVEFYGDTVVQADIRKNYTVEFIVDYHIARDPVEDIIVLGGETLPRTEELMYPAIKKQASGYTFKYWATIENGVATEWDFDSPVNSDLKLFAVYEDPDGNLVWGEDI